MEEISFMFNQTATPNFQPNHLNKATEASIDNKFITPKDKLNEKDKVVGDNINQSLFRRAIVNEPKLIGSTKHTDSIYKDSTPRYSFGDNLNRDIDSDETDSIHMEWNNTMDRLTNVEGEKFKENFKLVVTEIDGVRKYSQEYTEERSINLPSDSLNRLQTDRKQVYSPNDVSYYHEILLALIVLAVVLVLFVLLLRLNYLLLREQLIIYEYYYRSSHR